MNWVAFGAGWLAFSIFGGMLVGAVIRHGHGPEDGSAQ